MLLKNYCILRIAAVQHPFPHKKALVDSYKSSIYITDIVKIIHKFIDKRGVYNIGGEKKSIYEFVKHSKPDIDKISIIHTGLFHSDKIVNLLKTEYNFKEIYSNGLNKITENNNNSIACTFLPNNIKNKFGIY